MEEIPHAPPGEKFCLTCGLAKPLTEFWAHQRSRDGRQAHCAECAARRLKAGRERATQVARSQGTEYARVYRVQEGNCVVCGQPEALSDDMGGALPLSWFLSSTTRVSIKALACRACLNGVSLLRHSPRILMRAIELLVGATMPAGNIESGLHVEQIQEIKPLDKK